MMNEKETVYPPWPPELDALTAAPRHHRLLFENEQVRVLDTLIPSGETTAVHTHRWPASLYVLSWSDFIRYGPDGNIMADSGKMTIVPKPGTTLWSEPLEPHALKNVGNDELHVISVELKERLTTAKKGEKSGSD